MTARTDAPADGPTVQVWFAGATTTRPVRADGAFVGAGGELKLFVGHTLTVIIAAGQWVFVEL